MPRRQARARRFCGRGAHALFGATIRAAILAAKRTACANWRTPTGDSGAQPKKGKGRK